LNSDAEKDPCAHAVAGWPPGSFSTTVTKALETLPPAWHCGHAIDQRRHQSLASDRVLRDSAGLHVGDRVVTPTMAGSTSRVLADWRTLYLVGTILVTMVFNVPRNNALAVLAPSSPEAARLWAAHLSTCTAWNHVRTIVMVAAASSSSSGPAFEASGSPRLSARRRERGGRAPRRRPEETLRPPGLSQAVARQLGSPLRRPRWKWPMGHGRRCWNV
jgi:Anthrone oxygenase